MFGNPVYVSAVILLLVLISLRSETHFRKQNIFSFVLGGLLEILIVFLPIVLQAGLKEFWAGLAPMLFRSFAVELLSDSSPSQKLTETFHLSTTYLLIIPISVCVWFFFRYLSRKKATGITQRSAVLILLSTFVFIDLLYNICFWDNWISIYRVGFFFGFFGNSGFNIWLFKTLSPVYLYWHFPDPLCISYYFRVLFRSCIIQIRFCRFFSICRYFTTGRNRPALCPHRCGTQCDTVYPSSRLYALSCSLSGCSLPCPYNAGGKRRV